MQDCNTGISQEAKKAKLERYKEKGVIPSGPYMLRQMAIEGILPTPAARDWKGKTNPGVVKQGSGCIYGETLPDTIDRLYPTPTAIESVKGTNKWNPNSQMGQSLSAMAGSGMLPTPVAEDYKKRGPNSQQQQLGEMVYEMANGTKSTKEAQKSQGVGVGQTSRLSPLFTEEMMGFPFGWTTFPFLNQSGGQNHSKPTETQ